MKNQTERTAVHVIVSGRVQGVGYRAWTAKHARMLGLAGWVKNMHDGGVEAVFMGEASLVSQMTEAMRRGPAFAEVQSVEVSAYTGIETFNEFSIRN